MSEISFLICVLFYLNLALSSCCVFLLKAREIFLYLPRMEGRFYLKFVRLCGLKIKDFRRCFPVGLILTKKNHFSFELIYSLFRIYVFICKNSKPFKL